ncbi:alpha beta hydrolase fold family protein [Apiospora marii]|uniref:alpha beta hydrolase fold family protein n=1 Tax=Apiospora marii TaxID=335849 RepID=UPI0031305290
MIGNSLGELLFIRLCILLLQYGTPILLAGLATATALGGWDALTHPASEIAIGYVLLDALYFLLIWLPWNRRLRDEVDHQPALSHADRRALFLRCEAHVPDFDRYLRLWFLGADPSEIRRDNVRDFVLWAFFDRRPGAESDDEAAEAEDFLDRIEGRLGRELPAGRGRAQGLRLTFDDIEARYRSFVWYVIIGIVDVATHVQLAWRGFEYHALPAAKFAAVLPPRLQSLFARNRSRSGELSYWHRAHTAGPDRKPVVFLHGIGVGLWTYASFLADLGKDVGSGDGDGGQVGIIALEIMPISFRLTAAPLGKLDFLDEMERVLAAHGWDQFVLVTHSYGSALATQLLHSDEFSARVDAVVLVDPVTILLHNPDVAFNFTRRRPRLANEWQLWYFASMDPGTAHTLGRHFHWKQNIIWKEELVMKKKASPDTNGTLGRNGGVVPRGGDGGRSQQQRNVAVCLAGRDLIVDTLSVAKYLAGNEDWLPTLGGSDRAEADDTLADMQKQAGYGYLEKDGIELLWFDGLDHAQVFDDPKHYDKVKAVIHRYCSS